MVQSRWPRDRPFSAELVENLVTDADHPVVGFDKMDAPDPPEQEAIYGGFPRRLKVHLDWGGQKRLEARRNMRQYDIMYSWNEKQRRKRCKGRGIGHIRTSRLGRD
jgi:hypothetical protein